MDALTMTVFFGKVLVGWVLVYSVMNLFQYAKAKKQQERFDRETDKYFKD